MVYSEYYDFFFMVGRELKLDKNVLTFDLIVYKRNDSKDSKNVNTRVGTIRLHITFADAKRVSRL